MRHLENTNSAKNQEETVLSDTTKIISKTNRHGVIQHVNDDFVAISGFSEKELIGKPHNIIRHEDVPPPIFEDMWRAIKKGIPWQGVLKNRTKSGGFYWVDALVSPSFDEKGNIIGHISVRRKASQKQIEQAQKLYKKISEGKNFQTKMSMILDWIYQFKTEKRLLFLNVVFTSMMVFWVCVSLYQSKKEHDFYQKKVIGSDYLNLFANFTQKLSIHRALSTIALSGDDAYFDKVTENEKEIDKLVEKISKTTLRNGESYLSEKTWKEIKYDWEMLKESENLSVLPNLKKHSSLISKSLLVNTEISDSANLNLDLFPDTIYVEILISRVIPYLTESLGQLKVSSALTFSRVDFNSQERLKIKGLASEIVIYSEQLYRFFEYVKKYNGDIDPNLVQEVERLILDTKRLSELIDSMLTEGENFRKIPAFKEMTALTNSYIDFNDSLHVFLDKKLREKMFQMKLKAYTSVLFFVLFVVVFHYLHRTIVRSIQISVQNSIADSEDHFKKISKKN